MYLEMHYGLNVHELLKCIYQNPNPYCDCIWRWELWEVIMYRREVRRVRPHPTIHKGIPWDITWDIRGNLSLSTVWGHLKEMALQPQKRVFTKIWPYWNPDLGLSAFRTMRKINLCWPQGLQYVIMTAQLRQISPRIVSYRIGHGKIAKPVLMQGYYMMMMMLTKIIITLV